MPALRSWRFSQLGSATSIYHLECENHENTTPEQPTVITGALLRPCCRIMMQATRNDAVVHWDKRRMAWRSRVKVEFNASLPRGLIHQQIIDFVLAYLNDGELGQIAQCS